MARIPLLILLLFPLAGAADSTIYRTTDAQGNVIFTDAPPADGQPGERVDVPPVNTTPAPQVRESATEESSAGSADRNTEEEAQAPPQVAIIYPPDETTIPRGPGNFAVTAEVSRPLQSGQRLQLRLDGDPSGEPQREGTWNLTNVLRGAHDLTVSVLGEEGKTLATSEPVRVYGLRPSLIQPNRPLNPGNFIN